MEEQEEQHVAEHKHRKAVIARLSRIEGHVKAVKRMLAEDESCPDILIQLAAIRSAVDRAARLVLEDHMESCLYGAASKGMADHEWKELKRALDQFVS